MKLIIPISSTLLIASSQKYDQIENTDVFCTKPETLTESDECGFQMCGCINDYVPGIQREFDFEKISTCDFSIEHKNCTQTLINLSQQKEAITKELAIDEEAEQAAQQWLEEKLRKKAENRQKKARG